MFGGFFGGSGSSSSGGSNEHTTSNSPSDAFVPDATPSPFNTTPASLSPSGGGPSETKTRIQNAIVQQSNLINAKYLIQKINDNCFEHCVPEPGSSLSSREQSCLSTCMEKYIDGWNVVSKTYVARLQKEGASMRG